MSMKIRFSRKLVFHRNIMYFSDFVSKDIVILSYFEKFIESTLIYHIGYASIGGTSELQGVAKLLPGYCTSLCSGRSVDA